MGGGPRGRKAWGCGRPQQGEGGGAQDSVGMQAEGPRGQEGLREEEKAGGTPALSPLSTQLTLVCPLAGPSLPPPLDTLFLVWPTSS